MELPDPVQIESASDLVRWVERAERFSEPGPVELWFRGHKTAVSEIRPAILRGDIPNRFNEVRSWQEDMGSCTGPIRAGEMQFNKEFIRRAASLLPDREDLVDAYFLAQHHGLPTRLLDWTTNPLAALFFAACGEYDTDGEVVVISPIYSIVQEESGPERDMREVSVAFEKRDPLVKGAIASLFGKDDCPKEPTLLFVTPDLDNPRMMQQAACFTLHMPGSESVLERQTVRFPVPSDQKLLLQESLRTMGVSWATLFPDLDHVSREMVSSYGFDIPPRED